MIKLEFLKPWTATNRTEFTFALDQGLEMMKKAAEEEIQKTGAVAAPPR